MYRKVALHTFLINKYSMHTFHSFKLYCVQNVWSYNNACNIIHYVRICNIILHCSFEQPLIPFKKIFSNLFLFSVFKNSIIKAFLKSCLMLYDIIHISNTLSAAERLYTSICLFNKRNLRLALNSNRQAYSCGHSLCWTPLR